MALKPEVAESLKALREAYTDLHNELEKYYPHKTRVSFVDPLKPEVTLTGMVRSAMLDRSTNKGQFVATIMVAIDFACTPETWKGNAYPAKELSNRIVFDMFDPAFQITIID